ncbi:MAG: phage holin family protein [Vampirovibrio sp.]|nr:phage holin family protein [Vampirovibrio sp.]
MLSLLISWVLTAVTLLLISQFLPGVQIDGFFTALIATLVIGLVNSIIKPIVAFFTLPVTFLTLGLFAFIVNAMMFSLAAWFVPGFEVTGFWSALFGSLILAFFTSLIGRQNYSPA